MRSVPLTVSIAWIVVLHGCAGPTAGDDYTRVWSSEQASLSLQFTTSKLLIYNSGSCYGQYGDIDGIVSLGRFDLGGMFTQFIGTPPGQLRYSARFTGTRTRTHVTITVQVPSLQQSFGPYVLASDVTITKDRCFYP